MACCLKLFTIDGNNFSSKNICLYKSGSATAELIGIGYVQKAVPQHLRRQVPVQYGDIVVLLTTSGLLAPTAAACFLSLRSARSQNGLMFSM